MPAAAAVVCLTLAGGAVPAGAATTITDFALPAGQGTPAGIAVDSHGAVWFTEAAYGAVGRFAGGTLTRFSRGRTPRRPHRPSSLAPAGHPEWPYFSHDENHQNVACHFQPGKTQARL